MKNQFPSSAKQAQDLKKDLERRQATSFVDVPGLPVDDQGNPTTNLTLAEFNNQGGEVMAGHGAKPNKDGSKSKIHDLDRLVHQYGPGDWQKVKSKSHDGLEIHIYRNAETGQIAEYKTKVSGENFKQTEMRTQGREMTGEKARALAKTEDERSDKGSNNGGKKKLNEKPNMKDSHRTDVGQEQKVSTNAKRINEISVKENEQTSLLKKTTMNQDAKNSEKRQREKLTEMKKQAREMTSGNVNKSEKKDKEGNGGGNREKLTEMKKQAREMTGVETRQQAKIEKFKENFQENSKKSPDKPKDPTPKPR